MNRKTLSIALPILGAAIVIGAGFSAWVFAGEVSSSQVTGTVEITPMAADFGVTMYYGTTVNNVETKTAFSSFALELDQGAALSSDLNEGITAYIPATDTASEVLLDNNVYIEVYYQTAEDKAPLSDLFDGYSLTIDFSFAYKEQTNAKYVIEDYADMLTADKTPAQGTVATEPTTLNTWSSDATFSGTVVYQSTALGFGWQYVKKPSTEASYNSMVASMSNSGTETGKDEFVFTLTTSFTWTATA